jgi:hypothetical protein
MGVDHHSLQFLVAAHRSGTSFDRFLMIGRQRFQLVKPKDLQIAIGAREPSFTIEDATGLLEARNGFVEPLLELMGARTTESLDYSSYEQASLVHDLNVPVPDSLKHVYSCVFDSGTIEHVFNFPQAIKNCMDMTSTGGHLILVTTANNFMGHGFYQFSPELYYRVLCQENGFLIEEMILCEIDRGAPWYRVADPKELGCRVEWVNCRPTYIMVRARKICPADVFSILPQQSDYSAAWSQAVVIRNRRADMPSLRTLVPEVVKRPLRRFIGRKTPKAFRRIIRDF